MCQRTVIEEFEVRPPLVTFWNGKNKNNMRINFVTKKSALVTVIYVRLSKNEMVFKYPGS